MDGACIGGVAAQCAWPATSPPRQSESRSSFVGPVWRSFEDTSKPRWTTQRRAPGAHGALASHARFGLVHGQYSVTASLPLVAT
jgi:hypothetical protein